MDEWRFKALRITKYNPTLRDAEGRYLHDEWTSYADIGKSFKNGKLTFKEYSKTENRYIQAIELFLKSSSCSEVVAKRVEKYCLLKDFKKRDREFLRTYEQVAEGKVFKTDSLTVILKLILREYLWCELHCSTSQSVIRFGYDYYMYFSIDSGFKKSEFLKEIEEIGLFAE